MRCATNGRANVRTLRCPAEPDHHEQPRTIPRRAYGPGYELTLSYPRQADHASGRISILSAAGSALLGLSEQQQIDWRTGNGNAIRIKVLEVTWRPEANGRFDL